MTLPSHSKKIGLLLGVMLMTAAAGSPAHAKTCFPYGKITATAGIAVSKNTAKMYGRINWRVKVRAIATLGTAYDNWGLAVERSYNCKKKWGTWRCNATARPCRP